MLAESHQKFTGSSPEVSPEFHQNFTGIHWNFHQKFTGISHEFRQNFELEQLKKGNRHNSAFPQRIHCLFYGFTSLPCPDWKRDRPGTGGTGTQPASPLKSPCLRGAKGVPRKGSEHRSTRGFEHVKNWERNAIKPVVTCDPQNLGPP